MTHRIDLKRVIVGALASVIASTVRLCQALAFPVLLYLGLSLFAGTMDQEAPVPLHVALIVLGSLALQTIIAVTTHRIVMLGEQSVPSWGMGWSMRETRYVARVLGLVVLALPFSLLALLIPIIGPVILLTAGIVVGSAISLVFPAVSVDQPISYREAWDMAQGNLGPLVICVCLFPLTLGLPIGFIGTIPYMMPIAMVLQIFLMVLTIAVISMAYMEINRTASTESRDL